MKKYLRYLIYGTIAVGLSYCGYELVHKIDTGLKELTADVEQGTKRARLEKILNEKKP